MAIHRTVPEQELQLVSTHSHIQSKGQLIEQVMEGRWQLGALNTHPESCIVVADAQAVDGDVGGVILRDPLALGVEDAGESGVLVCGELLAEPGDPGPPPLLRQLLELEHLQLGGPHRVPLFGRRRPRLALEQARPVLLRFLALVLILVV